MRWMIIIRATRFLPPSGTMTSAYRLEGSTNWSCMGLTVDRYCSTTESKLRPRSFTSRVKRRRMRTSASVSTKILMSSRSRSSLFSKMRMPSTRMTLLGDRVTVSSVRS